MFKNLKSFTSYGMVADLSPLSGCKELECIDIDNVGMVCGLENLINLPLKRIRLGGRSWDSYLSNYSETEFDEIVSRFKSKPIVDRPRRFYVIRSSILYIQGDDTNNKLLEINTQNI